MVTHMGIYVCYIIQVLHEIDSTYQVSLKMFENNTNQSQKPKYNILQPIFLSTLQPSWVMVNVDIMLPRVSEPTIKGFFFNCIPVV